MTLGSPRRVVLCQEPARGRCLWPRSDRPLGVSGLKDKLVQGVVVEVLHAIYVMLRGAAVVPAGLAVDAGGRPQIATRLRRPQPHDVGAVVQERGELLFPRLPCYLAYPLEGAGHAGPELCRVRPR